MRQVATASDMTRRSPKMGVFGRGLTSQDQLITIDSDLLSIRPSGSYRGYGQVYVQAIKTYQTAVGPGKYKSEKSRRIVKKRSRHDKKYDFKGN
ncbi:hypothetical protein RRG08_012398 [Elysia crispata]|uniref:Uncharacterized protein n=1 Tax=Elysia crispata TaxID=231223 RepID=A0AAE1D069_9GAST|nr:hypothetical protein RRG08_012398 [Elysia crispata]